MFVDKVQISIKAGDGGSGCCSFRREAFLPKGGPDGGDGGNGGNVIFQAAPGEQSLLDFVYNGHFEAEKGVNGKSKDMIGRKGKDVIIKVPPGTVIRNVETGEVLADIDSAEKSVVVARGGRGGKGNARFATSTNRAPRERELGEKVESMRVELELKMIADIGLVGFPNAGKSTILAGISNANPKIAPYPFTTLHPVIGVVQYDDFSTLLVADVPGLIDGAHRNVGLGHTFLRHIERTKMLVYVLDAAGVDGRDPLEDLKTLKKELELYMEGLSARAGIVVANKKDLPESAENIRNLKKHLPKGLKLITVSALTDPDLTELKNLIRTELEKRNIPYYFTPRCAPITEEDLASGVDPDEMD
ncbi:MAG: GTPase ObgE [Lentisphaeria bacterium]|nr:GTPase ObgE [Lentisphaeria bacterium]